MGQVDEGPHRPVSGGAYDPSRRAASLIAASRQADSFTSAPHGPDDDWQRTARPILRSLLSLNDSAAEFSSTIGARHSQESGFQRLEVTLQGEGERLIPLQVCSKAEWSSPRPAVICLQGTNSGFHLSWGEEHEPYDVARIENGGDYARQAVDRGFVAIALEQACFGQRQELALRMRSKDPCIDHALHLMLTGSSLLAERVRDVLDARHWIVENADHHGIDPSQIFIMGNSSGGGTAIYALAADSGFAGGIVSGAVGRIDETIGARGASSGQMIVPGILNHFEMEDVVAMVAPRPLVLCSGRDDHIFPFSGVQKIAEAVRVAWVDRNAGEKFVAIGPEGPHRFYPNDCWPAFTDMIGVQKEA